VTDVILFILKILILAALYVFIWLVLRRAVGDVYEGGGEHAPDIVPLDASPQLAPVTPGVRRVRREKRAVERTSAGESLDLTEHLNPRLVVDESPILAAGLVFPLEGWVLVGRAPSSDIVLDEPFVSQTHARLRPVGQFFMVEDLGSTNGTYINEKEVTEAQLRFDSRLRIGETIFRYEE
jgi:hypothetical protein